MTRPDLQDFDLVLPPKRLYHAAPLAEHASILEHGLDPKLFPRQRWDDNDLGIWGFDDLGRAVEHAEQRGRGPIPEPYEVWEIDAEGLELRRPWFNAELNSGDDVWYFEGSLPPERVRLASSVSAPQHSSELESSLEL
jgi:hypothetical protein